LDRNRRSLSPGIGVHFDRTGQEVDRVEDLLAQRDSRAPTEEESVRAVDLPPDEMVLLRHLQTGVESLDSLQDDSGDQSDQGLDQADVADTVTAALGMQELLTTLTPRQQFVVVSRIVEGLTLDEVGEHLGGDQGTRAADRGGDPEAALVKAAPRYGLGT
jgi:DNA-directed RNA polymerase sigma subunit (sigma70/sigma32)